MHFAAKFWWVSVYPKLISTFVENILTWDRASLISILIAGYDFDLSRWIRTEIHMKSFEKTTTFLFHCVIQQLCDAAGVQPILEVDQQIEVTCMADISLIKDWENSVLAHRA